MLPKVKCLECEKEYKSLGSHLHIIHKMTIPQYREKYGEEVPIGWTVVSANLSDDVDDLMSPTDLTVASMSKEEKKVYREQYDILFNQAGKDPVLAPSIHDICFNSIIIARLQIQINKLTKGTGQKDLSSMKVLAEVQKTMENLQKRNLDNLKSLNLTKEQQDAQNKTPETTPTKLVSAFAWVLQSMSKDDQQKLNEDALHAMERLRNNQEDLLNLIDRSDGEEIEIDTAQIDNATRLSE